MSSPPSNVSSNKQLFKKSNDFKNWVKSKSKMIMATGGLFDVVRKGFHAEKNGRTDFGQRVFSHSQCMVVSKKEKVGGY